MLIGPLGTNFIEILIAFENVVCEMAAIFLGLNVLIKATLQMEASTT